jgi:hypothetical protein
MMSPGSRRSEQRQEKSGRSTLQHKQSVPLAFRTSSAVKDEQATKSTLAWAHSRYRANVLWNQMLCFPRTQHLDSLTLRCTEGGAPMNEVCLATFKALAFKYSLSDCVQHFRCMIRMGVRVARVGTWAPHAWIWLRSVLV